MLKNVAATLIIATACVSCVPLPKWQTPSGNPEVVIKGKDAKGKILGRMVAKQWEVKSESDHSMTLERQQLSAGNRAVFALAGNGMGILEGWNLVMVPDGGSTRVTFVSRYVQTKEYGKMTNPPTQQAGDEFMATLNGL